MPRHATPDSFAADLRGRGAHDVQTRRGIGWIEVYATHRAITVMANFHPQTLRFHSATRLPPAYGAPITTMKGVIAVLGLRPDKPWKVGSVNGGKVGEYRFKSQADQEIIRLHTQGQPAKVWLWSEAEAGFVGHSEHPVPADFTPPPPPAADRPAAHPSNVSRVIRTDAGYRPVRSGGEQGVKVSRHPLRGAVDVSVFITHRAAHARAVDAVVNALAARGYTADYGATYGTEGFTDIIVCKAVKAPGDPTYGKAQITAAALRNADHVGGGPQQVTVDVAPGETAWNPATTKDRPLTGPATYTYTFHADDGGINARRHPLGAVPETLRTLPKETQR